jgi:hypothetical protein
MGYTAEDARKTPPNHMGVCRWRCTDQVWLYSLLQTILELKRPGARVVSCKRSRLSKFIKYIVKYIII